MPRKIRCTVQAITGHGGQVYTIALQPETAVPPFRPGQFLHLTVDDYDPAGFWPESRVFSIANSPQDRSCLRICYSVKGRYTAKMEQALRVGGQVWIKLPYGDFVINQTQDAVLLAGGTGISAFTAFLEGLRPEGPPRITLVYGARNTGLFLFQDLLLGQLSRVPDFDLVFFTETEDAGFRRRLEGLPKAPACLTGRLSLDPLWPRWAGPERKTYYLSGPPAMLGTLTAALQSRGIPPAQIRTDAWE
jgi:ferredoxin-NADP reductase